MFQSTTSVAEPRVPYTVAVHSSRSDVEVISRQVADALGGSVWQTGRQTFNHRWKGEDTLTWGDQEYWRWINLVRFVGRPVILKEIVEGTRMSILEKLLTLREPAIVRRFFLSHPSLIDFVFEAYPYIQRHFGNDTQVALEVVRDPEAASPEELFAYIRTSLPVNEAIARLDHLDEWFLDQVDRVGGRFNFNLEFV